MTLKRVTLKKMIHLKILRIFIGVTIYSWVTFFCSSRIKCLPCEWDMNLSAIETISLNCGYRCPDPWGKENPHYCGAPHPCCCAPKCDINKAKKDSFLGINWNDKYSRYKLPRNKAFSLLKENGFHHIKIFMPDGLFSIKEVYGNDVSVYLGLPNNMLTNLASDLDYVRYTIRTKILPYKEIIKLIIVGNEPFLCIKTLDWAKLGECGSLNIPAKLLPSMKNVKNILLENNLNIPVTTALNGGILEMSTNPWTPCVSDYKESVKPLLKPIWVFLRKQKPPAPFIVNLYSWFASMAGHLDPTISTGYPDKTTLPSDGSYNYYFNFDMQYDMQIVAMCKNNVTDLDLWVGETGWPSEGHPRATSINSYYYNMNVIKRSKGMHINDASKDNTRLKRVPLSIFLFEAFDERYKYEIEHGNEFENSFGLFYEDGKPKWVNSKTKKINLPLKEEKKEGEYFDPNLKIEL